MENPDDQKREFDPKVLEALERRRTLLGKETFDAWETANLHLLTIVGNMKRGPAIDKLTALALFRTLFPDDRHLQSALTLAKHSLPLPDGSTVYRLPNGDWIQTQAGPKAEGHYIPACFPWAEVFERALQMEQPALAATAPTQVLEVTLEHIEQLLQRTGT